MKKLAIIVLIYALIILVGGIMGHIKAGSTASLITGISSGILLFVCSAGIFFNKRWGVLGSFLCVFLLDAFFFFRLLSTQKFFPSGAMSLLSLAVLVIMVVMLRRLAPFSTSHAKK